MSQDRCIRCNTPLLEDEHGDPHFEKCRWCYSGLPLAEIIEQQREVDADLAVRGISYDACDLDGGPA